MSEVTPLSFATPVRYRSCGEGSGVRPNKQIHASRNKLLKKIRKCEKQIENLKTLPYYTVFNQRAQQEKDIAKAEKKLQKKLMRLFGDPLILSFTQTHSAATNKQITASTNQQ